MLICFKESKLNFEAVILCVGMQHWAFIISQGYLLSNGTGASCVHQTNFELNMWITPKFSIHECPSVRLLVRALVCVAGGGVAALAERRERAEDAAWAQQYQGSDLLYLLSLSMGRYERMKISQVLLHFRWIKENNFQIHNIISF